MQEDKAILCMQCYVSCRYTGFVTVCIKSLDLSQKGKSSCSEESERRFGQKSQPGLFVFAIYAMFSAK